MPIRHSLWKVGSAPAALGDQRAMRLKADPGPLDRTLAPAFAQALLGWAKSC